MNDKTELRIGLALGSGSSRGFSHIGIINELMENGVVPDVICGTSVGAMIGASWATGRMARLEEWAGRVTKFQAARFLDINARFVGFVDLARFNDFLDEFVANDDDLIENCESTYGAISTELATARERWMTRGSLKDAVWASMALPGLFPPKRCDHKWLMDGGLVNPVPISLCHALGANFIIAVNLNGDIVGKHLINQKPSDTEQKLAQEQKKKQKPRREENNDSFTKRLSSFTRAYAGSLFPATEVSEGERAPSLINVIASAVNITQDRITRSRMAGDPPDILLAPKLAHIGLLELYRAQEAIDEGRQCVRRMLPEIERIVDSERESGEDGI
jgi:NTE family protein